MEDKRKINMENIEDIYGDNFEKFIGGANKVFEIPLFQRNYSWDKKSCEQLFNDILDAFHNKKTYFIGIFMFYNSEESSHLFYKSICIDGQQRITTLLLLLCAMRDTYNSLSCINEEFLMNNNEKEKYRFKLKQNYNDYDDFLEIMKGKVDDKKRSNIYDAYNNFIELLKNESSLNFRNINSFYKTIKKLEAIEIKLKNDNIENVQNIFEKINSTGIELSSADLIRNFLLFSSSTEIQEKLHDYWKVVEKIVGEKNLSKFAKSFLIRHTFEDVSSENVYSEFKKQFKNYNHEDILKSLVHYATLYAIVEYQRFYEILDDNYKEPVEYNFDSEENKNTKKYNQLLELKTTFALLNKIGTDEINPFFFQLCDGLYPNDLKKLDNICELILEFMIRYRVVQPSGGGGALSNKIRNIMKKLNNEEYSMTKKDIYFLLSNNDTEASKYPGNEAFIAQLKDFITIKNARVLLYQYARRIGQELVPFENKITLEHLMPQTIDDNTEEGKWWVEHLGGQKKWKDVHDKYLNCIGNMGLLTRSLNSSISNSSWDKKKKEIKEKALDNTTRDITLNNNWSGAQIKNRNNAFSKKISQVITGPKYERSKDYKWL